MSMPGHMDDQGRTPDPNAINRIHMPEEFLRKAYPLFVPGTTLVITDAPALESTTNVSLTVFDTLPPSEAL